MSVKDITVIREDYENGLYNGPSIKMIPKRVPDDFVFDENFTIKENRDKIAAHNAEVEEKSKEYRRLCGEANNRLTEDVILYIMDAYGFSRRQAEKTEAYVYEQEHSNMYGFFDAIDDVAGIIQEVMEA